MGVASFVIDRPEWWEDAACRGRADLDFIGPNFPRGGGTSTQRRQEAERVAACKTVCAACPAADRCLDEALTNDLVGIWGGLTDRERRPLRANSHGTRSRYMRGCRCHPCRAAAVTYNRERNRRLRSQQAS
jgi:hypothetical protein